MDCVIYRYSWCFSCLFLIGCENPPETPIQPENTEPLPLPIETQEKDYTAVPARCIQYREILEEVADCPARRAAMMEQESSCKRYALSVDGGEGLFQVTGEATRDFWENHLCRDLGPFDPYDESYMIRCGTRYAAHLTDSYTLNGVRVGEMRFNGGSWILWEMKEAVLNGLEPTIDNAYKFCGTLLTNGKKRASKWCKWNYDYYKHIEGRLPKYDGYERGLCDVTHSNIVGEL